MQIERKQWANQRFFKLNSLLDTKVNENCCPIKSSHPLTGTKAKNETQDYNYMALSVSQLTEARGGGGSVGVGQFMYYENEKKVSIGNHENLILPKPFNVLKLQ
jgi:hypothetical protein